MNNIVSKVIQKLSKTLATAPSLDRIKKLISEYYMGSTITLNSLNDKESFPLFNFALRKRLFKYTDDFTCFMINS